MNIYFLDRTNEVTNHHQQLLKRLGQYVATLENIPNDAEVSVSFVTNEDIQQLNRTYRQQNRPTDVISFAFEDSVEGDLKIEGQDLDLPRVLGDIVISIDQAKEQATQYNHSFERELGFLFVHGLLHLLGYDHMNKEDERKMFKRQEEILGECNLERS